MKKGFTLVELLAVIIILGLITGITVPIIAGAINNSKTKAYEEQINLIIDAGRNYMAKHANELPKSLGNKTYIDVGTLKTEGYLSDKDIKNPIYSSSSEDSKKKCQYLNGSVIITYQNSKYNYTYENQIAC